MISCIMEKRDVAVLIGILVGVSIPVALTFMIANRQLPNPIPLP